MFLLWLFCGCRAGAGAAAPAMPGGMPGGEPGWPGSPINYTPPWPETLPPGLPAFPGSGWEFDEPPPPAVQQRARQLVDELWARGQGSYRVEQTAGRWIAYQAQIVASGRRGVVAFRPKRASSSPELALNRSPARPRRAQIPSSPAASSSSSKPSPPAAAKPVSYGAPAPVSPVSLPTLVRGAGIKPKPPSPNVRILQQRLGIDADGQFGAGTESAVRAFQRAHGLDPDGIVGPKTWAALFATGARA